MLHWGAENFRMGRRTAGVFARKLKKQISQKSFKCFQMKNSLKKISQFVFDWKQFGQNSLWADRKDGRNTVPGSNDTNYDDNDSNKNKSYSKLLRACVVPSTCGFAWLVALVFWNKDSWLARYWSFLSFSSTYVPSTRPSGMREAIK